MPNHVTNRLLAPPDVISGLVSVKVDKRGDEYLGFDFGQLIPRPEVVPAGDIHSHVEGAAKLALGLFDLSAHYDASTPDGLIGALGRGAALKQLERGQMAKGFDAQEFEQFVQMMRSYRETGFLGWYDWNVENWGTKWGSYSVKVAAPGDLRFDTAWAPPHPVIRALAKETGVAIMHEWADEDTGRNVGRAHYNGTGGCGLTKLDETKEGYELAFELCGGGHYYRWNGERYVYDEEAGEAHEEAQNA